MEQMLKDMKLLKICIVTTPILFVLAIVMNINSKENVIFLTIALIGLMYIFITGYLSHKKIIEQHKKVEEELKNE
ncbi:hypothetical protein ACPF04_06175 [Campylobacter sp. MOP51]|uniref:hypothetical protein n=1 Tax=Campylobacter canis TaxID=3378588 RepID=UPI003C454F81